MIIKNVLKQKLLNTGLFLDNEYLDEYINLVLSNNITIGYTENTIFYREIILRKVVYH